MRIPRSLKKYLLMYSVVLLLPMTILTYFCYSYLIGQFQALVYENEKTIYQDATSQIEYKISQMRDISLQISNRSNVLPYHLSTDLESQVNMIETLRYSLAVSDSYNDLLLVDPLGNIHSPAGTYNVDTYSNIYNLSLDKLIADINNDIIAQCGIQAVSTGIEDDPYLYFATSYPYGSVYSGGALIFRIDREQFFSVLQIPCVVLYDDQLIAENGSVAQRAARYLDGDASAFNMTLSSGRVQVLAYQDENALLQNFYQVRTEFMVLEAALAGLSLLLILFFSYRSYKPMKKLKSVMEQVGIGDPGKEEIDASIASIEMLSQQNQEIGSRLLEEQYIVREMWLSRLVNRQYRSMGVSGVVENLKEYGVLLQSTFYAVCVFQCSQPIPKEVYPDTDSEDQPIKWYFFHDTDYRLTGIACGESLARILMEHAVSELAEQFALHDWDVECYVGNVCGSLEALNISYIQALSIVRYDSIKNGRINFYNAASAAYPVSCYPQEELNRLLTALQNKDGSAAETLLSVIYTRISSDSFDFSFSNTVGYAVVNTLIKSLSPEDTELWSKVRQYLFCLGRALCKEDVLALLDQIDLDWKQSFQTKPEQPVDKMGEALRFIDSHYTDTGFYIGQASDFCQMSINNFSQQFKHKFGISPVKYLTSIRIEEAKRLLVETKLPVSKVALRSGFSDISSFQRNFKTNVGVTPTQYRCTHTPPVEP